MKRAWSILIAPLLSGGLLAGIAAENRRHLTPADAEPYHRMAREAIGDIPRQIGTWIGRDEEVAVAAVKLLRPNVILSRTYVDSSPQPGRYGREAALLIVQTRESRDMLGHYPPNCYVSNGMTPGPSASRTWSAAGHTIKGMEYQFTQWRRNHLYRVVVYNFLIVPGRTGIVRDMGGVYKAAEDYQQRYFGAVQFQVVFNGLDGMELTRPQRDEIFRELIGPNVSVIDTLLNGGTQ